MANIQVTVRLYRYLVPLTISRLVVVRRQVFVDVLVGSGQCSVQGSSRDCSNARVQHSCAQLFDGVSSAHHVVASLGVELRVNGWITLMY